MSQAEVSAGFVMATVHAHANVLNMVAGCLHRSRLSRTECLREKPSGTICSSNASSMSEKESKLFRMVLGT